MAIKASALVADFNEALSAGWRYVSPGGTTWSKLSQTGVDCSGLFVAAFSRHGGSIYHGSNTMARKYTNNLAKLTKAAQLTPGMVVYKWQTSGGEPAKYQSDGLGDFHHVGLCVSTSPLRIVHASSVAGKVTSDSSIKNWKYCGQLKGATYDTTEAEPAEEESETMSSEAIMQAKVIGKALNIRAEQSKTSARLGQIPAGTKVDIIEGGVGWYKVSYNGVEGWCMADYLSIIPGSEVTDPADDETADAVDDDGNPVVDPDAEDGEADTEAPEGGYVSMAEFQALVERVEALERQLEG